jgi:hypothetical protein
VVEKMNILRNKFVFITFSFCAHFLVTLQQEAHTFSEFGYLEESDSESEINCRFDSFGTRLCDCGYGNQVSVTLV